MMSCSIGNKRNNKNEGKISSLASIESCTLNYTDLVELVVDFVEDERPVIVSSVQFNNLVNW